MMECFRQALCMDICDNMSRMFVVFYYLDQEVSNLFNIDVIDELQNEVRNSPQ